MELHIDEPILASADEIRVALQPSDDARKLYIEPAPPLDVMVEQLRYLAVHTEQSCSPKCAECVRLKRVKAWLLLPFRSRVYAVRPRAVRGDRPSSNPARRGRGVRMRSGRHAS
jgi:hypothetical protein